MGIKNQQKRGNVAALEPGIVSSLSFSATGGAVEKQHIRPLSLRDSPEWRIHGENHAERRNIMIVYVNTQGARLVKEGRHLLVKKGEATYHTLFTYKLKQIVLFGNVEITHRAMAQSCVTKSTPFF